MTDSVVSYGMNRSETAFPLTPVKKVVQEGHVCLLFFLYLQDFRQALTETAL